ncbi:MAG TPA: TadE family protein, partial [Candidatus Limnocylindrales bacterium]|nr:TadE family protein [Candidatus Limnocylindrales bacterium]
MAAAGSRRAKGSRGQSLVEFAILVPILATILMIAVDVGRIYLGWVSLTNVARIGANFASMNPDAWQGGGDTTVQARYRSLMQKDATNIDCVMPSVLPAPTFGDTPQYALGSRVQVNLTCSFALVTPFLSTLVGDGAGHISVSSNAVFTIRTGSVDGVTIGSTAATATPTAFPTVFQTTLPTPTPT